jgi:predicted RNase H-like HicB family nuclease
VIVKGYDVFIEPISVEADNGYAAVVAGLPGCMSDGDTPEEAMDRVGHAIDSWLAMAARIRHADPFSGQGLIA